MSVHDTHDPETEEITTDGVSPELDDVLDELTEEKEAAAQAKKDELLARAKEREAEKQLKRAGRRRLRFGGAALAVTVAVIAGVVLFNVVMGILGSRFPLTIDITRNQTFTLSDNSRQIIDAAAKLPDPV
ncbi:MAG: hypothetical protein FWF49_04980, partial [Oscillospiraceae bacterium]|nr:hypothetical protein [Oscillospiraceae bacterium]